MKESEKVRPRRNIGRGDKRAEYSRVWGFIST